MAFKKSVTLNRIEDNLIFSEAYHKVIDIRGDKNLVQFKVVAFANETASKSSKDCLDTPLEYNFIPSQDENAPRWDKQAYEHLKTLDEYKEITDC